MTDFDGLFSISMYTCILYIFLSIYFIIFSVYYRKGKSPSLPSKPLISLEKLRFQLRQKYVTTPSLKDKILK